MYEFLNVFVASTIRLKIEAITVSRLPNLSLRVVNIIIAAYMHACIIRYHISLSLTAAFFFFLFMSGAAAFRSGRRQESGQGGGPARSGFRHRLQRQGR